VLIIGLCEYELMGPTVINFMLTKSQIYSHIGNISMSSSL